MQCVKCFDIYKRVEYQTIKSRLEEDRMFIQVVMGPRQVGKSTVVKQVLDDLIIPYQLYTADNVPATNTAWISNCWAAVRSWKENNGLDSVVLVIDEIQKITNWSEVVKKEWDTDTFYNCNIKVLLIGSSRVMLEKGLSESLAGRFEEIRMSHWSFKEMKEAFGMDLEHYIFFGGYPGGVGFINNEVRWRKYIKDSIVAPAIAHDILMTKTIYKPELMKQLFELGCTYSGEEIALTKLLGQLQDAGNITTLANYLSTLNESHLLCGLQKYANDNARKYNSVPKMMVYNTALLSSLYGLNYSQVFTNPKMWGRWVESAVGTHLLNMANELDYRIYYWRERNNEVDFILEYNRQCIAIEVKSGRRTTNAGISVFKEKFRPLHTFIVGNGGIPLEEFLSSDLKYLFE